MTLSAGEVYSGGEVRDADGRMVVAVDSLPFSTLSILDYQNLVVAGDWVAAFQQAHTDLNTLGGGTLIVPDGAYTLKASTTAGGITWQIAWYGDNCYLACEPGAVFTVSNASTSVKTFLLGGASKPAGAANWFKNLYANTAGSSFPGSTVYAISTVVEGDSVIQFTNAGDESNFHAGDACYLLTGEVDPGGSGAEPDSEINQIVSVDTTNHRVTLLYPAAKAYAQENYAAAPPGVTSTTNLGTAAPFGIANVQDRTTRNISFTGLNITGDTRGTGAGLFNGGQILGLTVTGCNVVMGGSGAACGKIRGYVVAHNKLTINGSGSLYTWGFANTGSGDGNCYDNDLISTVTTAVASTPLKEGAHDVQWHHNRHKFPKSVTDNNHHIETNARCYRINITDNDFENGSTSAFIDIDPTYTASGTIARNRFHGTATTTTAVTAQGTNKFLITPDNDWGTFTNLSVTGAAKRAVTVTQSATPAINTDITDTAVITGLAQAITSMTTNLTGTPANDTSTLIVKITDNGTARAITWGAKFEASNVALPTTTVVSTLLTVGFIWNTATSAWRCVAVA